MAIEVPPQLLPEEPTAAGDASEPTQPSEMGEAAVPPVERRGRRRRIAFLVFLGALLGGLVLFSAWYLINRRPISEFPLPGVTAEAVPHYEFSVYGVVAPTGVAVSPDGNRIYVTQTEQDAKVLVLDRSGNRLATIAPPATTGSDHVPVYVALDPLTSDVYVSDRPTGSIYVYSADGRYRRTFDPGPTLAGWQPLGLGFDSKGALYVTDVSGPYNTVHVFEPDGKLAKTLGAPGQFNFPNGVAVSADGHIYVTDSNDGRLLIFDDSGAQVGVVARGAAEGNLGLPRGAAIDQDARIYVADTSAQSVQVYHLLATGERTPKFIGRFGTDGSGDGQFKFPNGVAVDSRARVYVTDWRNNRVQVWTY